MFSSLPHYPRFQVRLEATDPVPQFVNRRWRGYAEERREALVRYTTYVKHAIRSIFTLLHYCGQ